MNKKEILAEYQERKTGYDQALSVLVRLDAALAKHPGKVIDIRFFKEHFPPADPSWEACELNITPGEYGDGYQIYLGISHQSIGLQSRTTSHVKSRVKESVANYQKWSKEAQSDIDLLTELDWPQVVKDLRAIYRQYDRPRQWADILGSSEVIYPER